jgi:small GTP-binding protein
MRGPKVVFVGDSRVGKTTIIYQRTHTDTHDGNSTVGCTVEQAIEEVSGRSLALNLWDTAGQEQFNSLIPAYLRNAHAVIVVYDVMSPESFESVPRWVTIAKDILDSRYVLAIVANKTDLFKLETDAAVDFDSARTYASEINAQFFQVSGKTGDGIAPLFSEIAGAIAEFYTESAPPASCCEEPEKDSGCQC